MAGSLIGSLISQRLRLGLGQLSFVHLLIHVQRYAFYLHGHGRHHIGGLTLFDKGVETTDVHLLIAHDIGCKELASALGIKRLYGGILNSGKLTYHSFHLSELYAETANLDLCIPAPHKCDVAVGHQAHHIAGVIHPVIALGGREGVGSKCLGSLFGAVEIASRHLRTG